MPRKRINLTMEERVNYFLYNLLYVYMIKKLILKLLLESIFYFSQALASILSKNLKKTIIETIT